MEKAKNFIRELQRAESQIEERDFDKLKAEINSMLHCHLPGDMKLKDAETLAVVIFDIIAFPENYLNPH